MEGSHLCCKLATFYYFLCVLNCRKCVCVFLNSVSSWSIPCISASSGEETGRIDNWSTLGGELDQAVGKQTRKTQTSSVTELGMPVRGGQKITGVCYWAVAVPWLAGACISSWQLLFAQGCCGGKNSGVGGVTTFVLLSPLWSLVLQDVYPGIGDSTLPWLLRHTPDFNHR